MPGPQHDFMFAEQFANDPKLENRRVFPLVLFSLRRSARAEKELAKWHRFDRSAATRILKALMQPACIVTVCFALRVSLLV